MRIASLIIEGFVNSIYRSFIPMEALAQRGHLVHVEERNEVVRPERFLEFDVVCFWRCFHDPMQRLARQLSQHGVAMVWDNDDDLSSIPRGNPGYQHIGGLHGQRGLTAMARMMRLADVVTAPSAHLAERFSNASGVDVRVIENFLPDRFSHAGSGLRPGMRIGWVAGLEHRVDYEQLGLRQVFLDLLRNQPRVELITIGLPLSIDHPRYHALPIAAYGELPRMLSMFDIGIAPLADIPFNRARSSIKLKEYAAIGVPWLASPIGPYAGMGESQGGQLVPDDGWYDALTALVHDDDRRRRLALRARVWAREQTISRHVEEWERALEDAVEHARSARPAR